ncbi:unnamed protein product [Clavelina lepadiformis]|uniref:Uncharacterized protein n=1 Tax=Clavelina lepadiformis TaxID=159417 RepID=A0ABP0FHU5_CLALP
MFRTFCVLTLLSSCLGEIKIEPVVEMRWDFTDCGLAGRFGPSQEDCDVAYKGTNLEGDVTLSYGIQTWTVPASGLYLITARAPSGLVRPSQDGGEGAILSSNFRLNEGEQLRILVGQQSDYSAIGPSQRGSGGSGGTFITRVSDDFILLIAGGGSCGAGSSPGDSGRSQASANYFPEGKNASEVSELLGSGGRNGSGGFRGMELADGISSSGGGSGYYGDGELAFLRVGEQLDADGPRPAKSYRSLGASDNAAGVGGVFMFISGNGLLTENNGGFGGGGSGSLDGGAGGGGGYSGGGGGPPNGWGGGGGSLNNGENPEKTEYHRGPGSATITFIGYSCCGPIVVYIAMCFVAGIICAVLFVCLAYYIWKGCQQCCDNPESEGTWQRSGAKIRSLFRKDSEQGVKPFVSPRKYIRSNNRSYSYDRNYRSRPDRRNRYED